MSVAVKRDETGSIVPLLIGFVVVVALLVGVVVDASAAYLRRQGLHALADAAALAATEGLQGEQVYAEGLGERAGIDAAAAQAHVAEHLRATGAHERYPGLHVAVRTRENTVVVHLRARLDLPVPVPGVAGTATVTGSAASQVLVSQ